ncbi:hypothetical protein GCM10027280_13460 [Micromonospora polyrhachis]|nr:hypothetical protein [Micromonospora polyrhachis]
MVGEAVRELLVVLTLALVGLLLALLAAFTPWYDAATSTDLPVVVEMYAPGRSPTPVRPTEHSGSRSDLTAFPAG